MSESKNYTNLQREPIAVIGIGALFPGAQGLSGYWQTICEGRDEMRRVPEDYWLSQDFFNPDPGVSDRIYTDRGGFIDPVDLDVLASGVTPNNLSSTDASQLLALHVARQVLQSAGIVEQNTLRERTSVILGMSGATELISEMSGRLSEPVWRHVLEEAGLPQAQVQELTRRMLDYYIPWQETTFPGLLGNVVAGRIANRLDLHGTNCIVDAACASSFSALSMGLNELYLGSSDLVITGGVDSLNHPLMYMCFAQTGALSRSGDCRPFSDQADGTMMGEGVGMLALRRLSDAEKDGNSIYALIRGCGSSSDGLSKSVYAPRSEGQAIAIERAYQVAGYGPETVELVEAHGTATVAGDAAEFAGLSAVFGKDSKRKQWCALGSVKSQIGHTKGAAGAAGLIKSILAVHHKVLPPTIKVQKLNPNLDIDNSPFYINTQARPWVRDDAHPRRASASALGFGGSNFHVTIEEYAKTDETGMGQFHAKLRLSPVEAVLVCAEDISSTVAQCRSLLKQCDRPGALSYLAFSSQYHSDTGRKVKLVVIAKDEADLTAKLEIAIGLLQDKINNPGEGLQDTFEDTSRQGIYLSKGITGEKTAVLFPGQGSQYVGMGSDLAMFTCTAQNVWDMAASQFPNNTAPHNTVFPPPAFNDKRKQQQEEHLRQTDQAQPALGVCSLAAWKVMQAVGVPVHAVAGHSFGEVVALHVVGVYDESHMLDIASVRGELMAQAASCSSGAMSAILHDREAVEKVLSRLDDEVFIANYNSPLQTVISGSLSAVEKAERQLEQQGARVVRLPVATAFHSPAVSGAAQPFLQYLQGVKFRKARKPVIACSSRKPYPKSATEARITLAEQLVQPVLFEQQIQQLYDMGVRNFIEVGPGAVLTKLVDECLQEKPHRAIYTDRKGQHGVVSLHEALARLTIAGIDVQWPRLWDEYAKPVDPAKIEPAKLTRKIKGSNLDRPYPPLDGKNKHSKMAFFTEHSLPVKSSDGPDGNARDSLQGPHVSVTSVTSKKTEAHSDNAVGLNAVAVENPQAARMLVDAQKHFQDSMLAFQQSMTDAHLSYLHSMQALLGGVDASSAPVHQTAMASTVEPPVEISPLTTSGDNTEIQQLESVSTASDEIKQPPFREAVQGQGEDIIDADSIGDLFLNVVADKTGYPRDVLDLDMEMESGLGIDSIKRVEILSDLQQQRPELAHLDAGQMAALATLRDVVNAAQQALSGAIIEHDDIPDAVNNSAAINCTDHSDARNITVDPATAALRKGKNIEELLLKVVADKTGYPRDVLDLDMEMESGLGIDSIKRVEILAELQQHVPELAHLDAGRMATFATLRHVVKAAQQALFTPSLKIVNATAPGDTIFDSSAFNSVTAPNITALGTTAANNSNMEELFLNVVADKTGYPREVLDLDMDMESGLGIDSIKRVEILSELQQQRPELAHFDAGQMATLATLRDVVNAVQKNSVVGDIFEPHTAQGESTADNTTVSQGDTNHRHLLQLTTAPRSGFVIPGLFRDGVVAITHDSTDSVMKNVATMLADKLANIGVNTTIVKDVKQLPASLCGVVCLNGLRQVQDARNGITQQINVVTVVQGAAKALRRNNGFLVLAQESGNGRGANRSTNSQPWNTGMVALARTASIEWPEVTVRSIEGEFGSNSNEQLTALLFTELLAGGADPEITYTVDGQRYCIKDRSHPIEKGVLPLEENAVLVVSGGGRGVTAACIVELAKRQKLRFALLGRSELMEQPACCQGANDQAAIIKALSNEYPGTDLKSLRRQAANILASREIECTMAQLRASGSEALYATVDIQDQVDVDSALNNVREMWGGIDGIIHAAGVLADKHIEEKTEAQLQKVLSTKIKGLEVLLGATKQDVLRCMVMFSSVAARYGNAGQSDYAMANEVLNRLALQEARRRPECTVKSLMWGPWDGGMVTPTLKKHFAAMGVPLIKPQEGAEWFVDELCDQDKNNVLVILGEGRELSKPLVQQQKSLQYNVLVGAAQQPYLSDHSINGKVVLPVVQVVEWLVSAACLVMDDPSSVTLENLQVLSGVTLDKFYKHAELFHIELHPQGINSYEATLYDNNGKKRYQASIGESTEQYPPDERFAHPVQPSRPWPIDASEAYGKSYLFHGSAFQVIKELGAVSDDGGVLQVDACADNSWPGAPFASHPGLLDGCLQLPVLWGHCRRGQSSLPTAIDEIRWFTVNRLEGNATCYARLQQKKNYLIVDLAAYDSRGRPILMMKGVQVHFLTEPAKVA